MAIIAGMQDLLATHEWHPARTDAGAAAPVAVLVHGITGWWRTWWRVGPALADRGRRVIAVDLRGHGESPPVADIEGKALCDLDGILASLRANTGVRVADLAPHLQVPALYLIADEERSVLGAMRAQLIDSLPPQVTASEFESGHTIHRDRFDAYMATVLGWLKHDPAR